MRLVAILVLFVAMAVSAVADGSVAVRMDAAGEDGQSTDHDAEPAVQRKPYRSAYSGRIKLKPNRRLLVVTTQDEWNETLRRREDRRGSQEDGDESSPLPASVSPAQTNHPGGGGPPTPWTRLSPFLKRGLVLVVLTAIAVVDRSPSTALAPGVLSASGVASVAQGGAGSRWLPRFRFDWAKLRILPGEILPSLSAALMIAWVPSLVMQRAWFELAFLVLSLTSEANLRNYLRNEVLPALGGTVRKLFWSEFWKRAWDYLLEPFSGNLLVPPAVEENPSWTQWQSDVARFWSTRVVSRIDKWTSSSIKALLQKNVRSSVDGMAEDTWNAVAFAWYPDGRGRESPGLAELPPSSSEDTARMIEIETNCEEGKSDTDCDDDSTKAVSGAADDKSETTAFPSDDRSESDVSEWEDEESSDSGSSSTLAKDVSNCDEPTIEEPQPVLS